MQGLISAPPVKLLLAVEEAAERLSISRTGMYALVTSEQIFSIKLGRVRRVPVTALEQFVRRLEDNGWDTEESMKAPSPNVSMAAGGRVSSFPGEAPFLLR